MINTLPPPQTEERAPSGTPHGRGNRAATSFVVLVACVVLAIVCVYLGIRIRATDTSLADVKAQLAQASLRADETQTNLDAAKAQSTALQAQLVSERSSEQSQLDQAKALSAAQQAQLVSAEGRQSDLQSQLDKAKAQSTALQEQFNRASQESSAYRTQLDQAKSQAADMQAQLAKAQAVLTRVHPLIVEARQLPLTATFEKSFWDQGFTLRINNPGTAALSLRITISGADQPRAERAVIEGGETLNLGRLPAGENVVIASDGFDPLKLTAR